MPCSPNVVTFEPNALAMEMNRSLKCGFPMVHEAVHREVGAATGEQHRHVVVVVRIAVRRYRFE